MKRDCKVTIEGTNFQWEMIDRTVRKLTEADTTKLIKDIRISTYSVDNGALKDKIWLICLIGNDKNPDDMSKDFLYATIDIDEDEEQFARVAVEFDNCDFTERGAVVIWTAEER
jgi:hypothetical protein